MHCCKKISAVFFLIKVFSAQGIKSIYVHSLFHCTLKFYTAIHQTEDFYTGLFLKIKVNGFHDL